MAHSRNGYNPRQAHRAKRVELRARVASLGLPCALCGRPIDYSLPPGHPWSFELDEIVPISRVAPELRERAALDPANVQPAHRWCNAHRGNRPVASAHVKAMKEVEGSRDWLAD